jgi:hypothetical protein
MGLKERIKAAVADLDRRARPWVAKGPWHRRAYEFLLFGLKEAWACLFGGTMLALLVGTHLFWPAHFPLARYDFLVLAALGVQAGLLALKLERWEEARVIFVFHVVGTIMELFKTAKGSWIYPEPSLLRIGGVPLFSGFMYACIGSYIARATRILDLRISAYLVRREPRHLRRRLDLPKPAPRVAHGLVREGRLLVPADAAQLRAGQPGASRAAGERGGAFGGCGGGGRASVGLSPPPSGTRDA